MIYQSVASIQRRRMSNNHRADAEIAHHRSADIVVTGDSPPRLDINEQHFIARLENRSNFGARRSPVAGGWGRVIAKS